MWRGQSTDGFTSADLRRRFRNGISENAKSRVQREGIEEFPFEDIHRMQTTGRSHLNEFQ